jgi:hypothetical protein
MICSKCGNEVEVWTERLTGDTVCWDCQQDARAKTLKTIGDIMKDLKHFKKRVMADPNWERRGSIGIDICKWLEDLEI